MKFPVLLIFSIWSTISIAQITTVPSPFICMYGHYDNVNVNSHFDILTPSFTVVEGTSANAAYINGLRAKGVVYAAHVNKPITATTANLVAAWRAPFDNDLGGQLPGGYDAIAIDELMSADTDGTAQSNNVVAALQQLRALYPNKLIFVAAVWQFGQNSSFYADQLNAINDYADVLMIENYLREGNLNFNHISNYADNLKSTVTGILSKTVYGLYISQHGYVGDESTDYGFYGVLDEQFYRIKNDADAASMDGVMFWVYYRSDTEVMANYCAALADYYFHQGNNSYFLNGTYNQHISNPIFASGTTGWTLNPGTGGSVTRESYSNLGIRDNHSADPIRNMGQGPVYVSHGTHCLKFVKGSNPNRASFSINVSTDSIYNFSAWVYASANNNNAMVTITESNGTPIASKEITHVGTYDFARITFNFNPTSSPIKIILSDSTTTTGTTLYWDFIEMEDMGYNSINCNNTTGTDTQTACESYTWIDSNTYTSNNNTATHTLVNVGGCDSVVTLNLTINSSNTGTDSQTACDSYTWIDGNTYTSSNSTATHTLSNMSGCDSVVTLDLTITNSTSGTDTQTACDSYTWIDSNTYTSNNNTATHTLVNVGGCDSVVTLDLTINTVDNGITNSSPTLMANAIGSTYQWLDCDNNFQPITGETNQSFTPSANGNYAVEVTENNCVDTSDCETINTVVVIENSFEKILSFYPNPTTSMFTINLDHIYENISINVSTIGGKLVSTHTYKSVMNITFEIEGASEIYIIEVSNHEGKKARLKVFKQ